MVLEGFIRAVYVLSKIFLQFARLDCFLTLKRGHWLR